MEQKFSTIEVFVLKDRATPAIDHISKLLEKSKIRHTREENVLLTVWKTDHFDDLKIKISTNKEATWTYIVARFTNFYEVSEINRMKLAYDMLKESWKANGVKFAIDEKDDIILIAETNDTDLTEEEIQTLLGHVVHTCDTLYEIYPKGDKRYVESSSSEDPIDEESHPNDDNTSSKD